MGPEPARARRTTGGRDLPVAIAVGIGLVALVVGALLWHPAAFTVVVGIGAMVAFVELRSVLAGQYRVDVPVLVVATAVLLAGAYHARHAGQVLGVLALIAGGFLWHVLDRRRSAVLATVAVTTVLGLWVGFLASFAVLLVMQPGGVTLVLAVVGAVALADTGAFAAGVVFGRHPVAPRVSPSKTIEGLVGGLVLATVAGALVLPLLDGPFTPVTGAVLAAACAFAGFVGDLVESMVKRDLGVKDLGTVLPGHGGILDRVDGILLALPVGFYVIEVLV
jgi:phosphatidate cytidylyltransferase